MKLNKKPLALVAHQKTRFSITFFFMLFVTVWILYGHSKSVAAFSQDHHPAATTSQKDIALGLNHFEAHCASCHAPSGKADNQKGKSIGAADLTSSEVQGKSDAELMKIIQNGVKGTAMPAFAKTHKAAEIKQMIAFLRKLPALTADERKALEEAVPADARHKHGTGAHHEDGHNHEQSAGTTSAQPASQIEKMP